MKKSKNKSWSYGLWAQKIGISGNSVLVRVINGQREIGPDLEQKLAIYFNFNQNQKKYFHLLLELSRHKKDSTKIQKIKSTLRNDYDFEERSILQEKSMRSLSHWIFFIYRQSLKLSFFSGSIRIFQKNLISPVEGGRIKEAVNTLEKEELILKSETSDLPKWKLLKENVGTKDDVPSIDVKEYHRSVLNLGSEILNLVPVSQREFSSLNICFNEKDFTEARSWIREFEEKFASRFEATAVSGSNIYQFNTQFFPVTHFKEKKNETLN